MPYFLYYGNIKKPIKVLVDTGSNKNFIHPKYTKISHNVQKPFTVSSVGGDISINKFSHGKFFKPYSEIDVKFYHMPELKTFDAVVGHDTLKELGAVIDVSNEKLIMPENNVIPLLQHKFQEVNKIVIRDSHLSSEEKSKLNTLLNSYQDLFQPVDEKLPFTTRVKAEIR